MAIETPFDVLGLPLDATKEDVKRAFRVLAKQLHPDVAGPGHEDRLASVFKAYEFLQDDARRVRLRHNLSRPSRVRSSRKPRKPMALVLPVGVAYSGGEFVAVENPKCSRPLCLFRVDDGRRGEISCAACMDACGPAAGGHRIHIRSHLPREAAADISYPSSPAHPVRRARLTVVDDEVYKVRGLDLQVDLALTYIDLVAGCAEVVALPCGKRIRLKVPPGTRPGTLLRVPHQGLPAQACRGDLLVKIDLKMPKPSDISEADQRQFEALREWVRQKPSDADVPPKKGKVFDVRA